MKFKLSIISTLLLLANEMHSQFLWYENETSTENILQTSSQNGVFLTNKINPDTNGINTNTVSAKFIRDRETNNVFSYFELPQNIVTDGEYTISLKAYIDVATADLSSINKILVYLKNTNSGDLIQKTLKFTSGQEWEEFSFTFNPGDLPANGFLEGGYNQMYIGYGSGQESTSKVIYYVDQIYGSIIQKPEVQKTLVDVLKGSWGGRFYVRGGQNLDEYVASKNDGGKGYDYIAGAHEMANSYPTMGHVITNGTNNAKAQLWTLRTNPNVDAVMGASNSIIDEEFVPSLENEKIIIDVINILKTAGKKVILYVNTQSPANRSTESGAVAWNNYVDTYFNGNGHVAWMNYCEGYIKRFTEMGVDGYWFDAFNSYNSNASLGDEDPGSTDTQRDEFVQMVRNAAPNAAITLNFDKDYFVDEDGKYLLVDTDGVDDLVEKDYKIIKMTATNPWSDFTAGHITPLGQDAPPNSWAYEEFTVTDIEESSISIYEDQKQTLKHLFLPIRATWSSERSKLLFDNDQAYRFAKRITDAGGSVTFSNTTSRNGTTSADEVSILTFIDQQFTANAAAKVYERPLGAYLVGENQTLSINSKELTDLSFKIYPNPVLNSFKISEEVVSAVIYSIEGKQLLIFSGNEDEFNVSKLNTGVYFLKINDKKGNSNLIKFIKE